MKKILVWDMPIRLFHWSMALSFSLAWLLSEDLYLDIHVFFGYTFFGLFVFRLFWGYYGGRHARFRSFAYDWGSVRGYLKGLLNGDAARFIGHNPVGSWAIFLMIVLSLLLSVTGIITLAGEEGHGFAANIIPMDLGVYLHELHEWVAWAMLIVVCVHVGGVIIESLLHRENLIWTMISGHKWVVGDGENSKQRHGIAVLLLFLLISAGLYYFQENYKAMVKNQPYIPFKGKQLADNETWREECGDCHLAFHPSLLPTRSWKKLMEQQHEHFDEDLDLDEETVTEIKSFLLLNAAEEDATEPARKIGRSIPKDETPLRITQTAYWIKKHKAIPKNYYEKHPKVKSQGNCGACHLDAEEGTYEDAAMHMPEASSTDEPSLLDFLLH